MGLLVSMGVELSLRRLFLPAFAGLAKISEAKAIAVNGEIFFFMRRAKWAVGYVIAETNDTSLCVGVVL